jgi:hypothetical protein
MSWKKKALLTLLIVFIAIQFIQPAHKKNGQVLPTDIVKMYNVPLNVQSVLKTSCYDCHSNNTRYPWYFNIQPLGWMLNSHVTNGKENLNFSDFGSYSERKQKNKFRAIAKSIDEGSMPLWQYTIIHKDARLTTETKAFIINWSEKIKDSLSKKK